MKKILFKKILIMVLCILIFLTMNIGVVEAVSGSELAKNFQGDASVVTGESIITKPIGIVLSVVRIIATGVSVIVLIYLGIKYMNAAPSEKANIKSQLITFVIGAVVVVSATTIIQKINGFATTVTNINSAPPTT